VLIVVMSMVVASYAPASRSPVTRASSGARRVSHTQSWRPPPPPFFPASAAVKCRRPTLPVARSVGPPEKHRPVLNIPPTGSDSPSIHFSVFFLFFSALIFSFLTVANIPRNQNEFNKLIAIKLKAPLIQRKFIGILEDFISIRTFPT
jgi:hypothetical protein